MLFTHLSVLKGAEALWRTQMARQTSEMEKWKGDRDKSVKEHKKAFQRAIVSVEVLCACVVV